LPAKIYGQSTIGSLANQRGSQTLSIPIPDADLNDPDYASTSDGAEYLFHAWLERHGAHVGDSYLPVRLLWGIRPQVLPPVITPGSTYTIPVSWEEIPSYETGDPTPLSRAALWDSLSAAQHYNLVLQLIGGAGQVVASATNVTAEGSGTNRFLIAVPPAAQGPFTWAAMLQTAPQTMSLDLYDSFEGRDRGLDRSPVHPWFSYVYSADNKAVKLSEGVLYDPDNPTNKVAYMLVTNSPAAGGLSGFGIRRGTNDWALPADHRLWSNYVFSTDFKETRGQDCFLLLQIKDADGNWLEFGTNYSPGQNRWRTIRGSVDQFVPPQPTASFDRTRIRDFVVNVQMRQTNLIYEAYFDNIRFLGPPDLEDAFEDRPAGPDYSRIDPWQAYGYDEPNHDDVLLDKGVQLEASDGNQSAFVVAWNRTNSGNFAGFGMLRVFDSNWQLPADTNLWRNYSVAFDFKEGAGRSCMLELQLKNLDDPTCGLRQRGIHFTKPYQPDPGRDGWDTISATVDQFLQPTYFCPFDPRDVYVLVLNVQMLEKSPAQNVIYVGSFDNIRFNAPESLSQGELTAAIYTSTNDFFGFKSIVSNIPGKVVLTWSGGGTLEEANALGETWTKVTNATSPAILDLPTGNRFYRLRQ